MRVRVITMIITILIFLLILDSKIEFEYTIEQHIIVSSIIILFFYFNDVKKFILPLLRKHKHSFDIPLSNTIKNENTRDITSACICGEKVTINVHKESVAYKKFIKEI